MLYAELRSLIPYAYEGDVEAYTCFCELFIQVYTCFNDEEGTTPKEVQRQFTGSSTITVNCLLSAASVKW